MRVIICGAGKVGYNIAAHLAREENDVTVVDSNPSDIAHINNDLDVNGMVGSPSNPDVLNNAGAKDTDMIIAVTQSDEVNMVACQVAHSLFGVPKKIARIREQAYLDPSWSNLFSRAHMPIDFIISPEIAIASDIYRKLLIPGTTYVVSLAEEKAYMVGVICEENCPVVNTPIRQLKALFSDLSFEIVTILRDNKTLIPDYEDQLYIGDEVYFTVKLEHLERTMTAFGHEEPKARNIVISGGGNIAIKLVQLIQEAEHNIRIKIIEQDEKRAEFLSESLRDVIVLRGNSLDKDILNEASIGTAETLVAITNDDETNILGSLLAKQYGCRRVITLVNNSAYSPLVGLLGVDAMVSPRSTIVANIMQHVRRGKIKNLHNLRNDVAEVIEAEVSDTSSIANTKIKDFVIPNEVVVGGILRDGTFIIPDEEFVIKPKDHVIVLTNNEKVRAVERMFSVHVDLF